LREKSVHHTPATDDDAQTGEIRYKTPLKNELPGIRVQKTGRITGKSENRLLFSASLMNGSNLIHLLERHGRKARINLLEAKNIS